MSLKNALAGIKQAQGESEPAEFAKEPAPVAKRNVKPADSPVPTPARTTGKSSNPDYEAVKLYVRKQTRRAAERKWEDETSRDFSELVQELLTKYLGS